MLVLAIIWCLWLNRNSMIFRNHCRVSLSLIFQIITWLISWVDFLLTGHDSEAFSHAIQYMQQEWNQAQASQVAHDIASSIGIVSIPIPTPDASSHFTEAAYDPLAPTSTGSDNWLSVEIWFCFCSKTGQYIFLVYIEIMDCKPLIFGTSLLLVVSLLFLRYSFRRSCN